MCVCVISKQAKENQDKIFFLKEKKRIFCKKKLKLKQSWTLNTHTHTQRIFWKLFNSQVFFHIFFQREKQQQQQKSTHKEYSSFYFALPNEAKNSFFFIRCQKCKCGNIIFHNFFFFHFWNHRVGIQTMGHIIQLIGIFFPLSI